MNTTPRVMTRGIATDILDLLCLRDVFPNDLCTMDRMC